MMDWHILVIEDEHDSAEVIAEILSHRGIVSTQVGSAEDALALLNEWQPTAIIVDLHLPGSAFLQDARLRNLFIAVAAIVKLRDHEAGHVCDAGLNHTGGGSRQLTLVIGDSLEAATVILISTG